MTVREYIEYLQTLDQDKGIWVVYDGFCRVFEPIPDAEVDDDLAEYFNENYRTNIKKGDYVINAD